MNSGNVDAMLNGIQRLNPAAYHYLISSPAVRDQLGQLGATLPAPPELGWIRLKGAQPRDSYLFCQDLRKQYRTGVVIQVGNGQGPFSDTPFDMADRGHAGVAEARRVLARMP
jgi:hypothetical protein